jgi:hypothetical protein
MYQTLGKSDTGKNMAELSKPRQLSSVLVVPSEAFKAKQV